jgi:hypothetical protein
MRKTIIGAVAALFLLAAWLAWPLAGLRDLARAAQSGDVARIEQRVDFDALGRSLSGQLVRTYAELSGVPIVRGGLLAGIASAVADPMIARLLSRIALAELVQKGWPTEVLGERPPAFEGLNWNALGGVWPVYMNASYGFGMFRLWIPINQPRPRQFRIHLALSGWTWKVSGLDLPPELLERLVRELMKQQGKSG